MGWLILFCIKEIMASLSVAQVALAFIGGGLYSVGAIVYVMERPNPTRLFGYHEIWHSLVVLGCLSFFMVVFLNYI